MQPQEACTGADALAIVTEWGDYRDPEWEELREKYFHNKAFDSLDALEDQLLVGLVALEQDRPRVQSIVAWDWIINALMK